MRPEKARACYVFAHGAGAGMRHASMEAIAAGLAERGIATLRYQFPYMEKGSKRPDPPAVAHAAVRAAVAEAAKVCAGLPLIAGGKSFGGRMTSQAQAKAPLDGVRGIGVLRLSAASGRKTFRRTRKAPGRCENSDAVPAGHARCACRAEPAEAGRKGLGQRATLHLAEGADHSFHVLKSSGRNDREVLAEILDAFSGVGG